MYKYTIVFLWLLIGFSKRPAQTSAVLLNRKQHIDMIHKMNRFPLIRIDLIRPKLHLDGFK